MNEQTEAQQNGKDSVLRFQTNIPQEVALKFDDGKFFAGAYGDYTMFSLTDGRIMRVPPFIGDRIVKELKIPRGEVFSIGKFEKKTGQRRGIEWIVKRLDAAAELNGLSDAPKTAVQEKTLGPVTNGNTIKMVAINGNNGKMDDATAFEMVRATKLCGALKTAVAAAAAAEQFGKEINYTIRFTSDDVRAMAITVLIGAQQKERQTL